MDYSELKLKAEAAGIIDHNENPAWYEADMLLNDGVYYLKNAAFIAAAAPDVVLNLLADNSANMATCKGVIQGLTAERDTLQAKNQALLEALQDLKQQYSEHPDAFWDWSKARSAIAAAEGKDV